MRQRGYTLIEILVVVALLALAATAATIGLGSLTHGNLRATAMMISAGVRAGYGRAATTGQTVRLVLDLDSNKFWLEETLDRVVLDRDDETGNAGAAESAEEAEAPTGGSARPATAADAEGGGVMEAPPPDTPAAIDKEGRRRARFRPIEGRRGEKREPKGTTKLLAVYTAHERGRQESGRHALYFFPGGMTERAIIQIADPSGEVYSVSVHPLTGRTRVDDVPVEPESDLYEHAQEEEGEAPL
jgi:prepilin-type N-terminal cleavage/methylation domain-containing protein